MRKILLIVVSLSLVALFQGELRADGTEKTEDKNAAMSFKDFTEHLNLTKNTALHVKNFWTKTKGRSFTWSGKVVNVQGGRGKAEIHVANGEVPTVKGINLVLVTYNLDKAAALKIGEEIKFKGQVSNYRGRRDNPIIVYMNNVEILPLK